MASSREREQESPWRCAHGVQRGADDACSGKVRRTRSSPALVCESMLLAMGAGTRRRTEMQRAGERVVSAS